MRELLERKLFPNVIRPGRYAGGEPGQIVKSPAGRLNYLYAFPDKYEIGQSHLSLQTLYHIVNADDRFLCERVFAVDRDAEAVMRRERIPLFSLESSRPAAEFDVVGFTLTHEFLFANMLTMLDLAGIPIDAPERAEDHPLILAAGPAVYNPEPMAPFVDLFLVGDVEEGLPEILGLLLEHKSAGREERLQRVAEQVESVYVPRFYDDNRQPTVSTAPRQISTGVLEELKPDLYPRQPILPLIETAQNHLSVEMLRNCPPESRFYHAGPRYQPVRVRQQADILAQIDAQMKTTGYDEVALLSCSSSDYPEFDQLAAAAARHLEGLRVALLMPVLRPGSITPALLDAAGRVRRTGLTIAPEAGTDRLRRFIGLDFTDDAVHDSVGLVFDRGWTSLKLHFTIGLPTETEEDILGIAAMVRSVFEIGRAYRDRKNINIVLSPFVPEPHTPVQWDEMQPVAVLLQKVQLIRSRCRSSRIHFKHYSFEGAVLESVFKRGGRAVAAVIRSAFESGYRFDGWSGDSGYDSWFAALAQHDIALEDCLRAISFRSELPWSHINTGVSTEQLANERQRMATRVTEPAPEVPAAGEGQTADQQSMEFGRGRKKVATRNATAPTKNCVRLRWSKHPRYRYMSHLDNIRAIERALRRSRLPVAYSHGFHPTMKLSFGPPLPLGYTSEAEYFDVILESSLSPTLVERLKAAMPVGMEILEVRVVPVRPQSLSAALNRVVYTVPLKELALTDDLQHRIDSLVNAEHLNVERTGKSGTKIVDIRPAIYSLTGDAHTLIMTLGIGEGGYARPEEVVRLLDPAADLPWLSHRVHRLRVYRDDGQRGVIDAMDL